jgi:hypothetical protein
MKIAVITISRSGSSELIEILSKYNIDVVHKPYNYLYPNELFNMYGKNIKVIFITRKLLDVIKSIKQREIDYGINWIETHFKNLNSDFSEYNNIYDKDVLYLEKLYDEYVNQNFFDVLFIKYENLYIDGIHKIETINVINNFIGKNNLLYYDFKFNLNNKWKGNYNLYNTSHKMSTCLHEDISESEKMQESITLNENINKDINEKIYKTYNSLQDKIDKYNYKLLKKNIKLAHVVNPVKCNKDNLSYLYYAQPITFLSMYNSKIKANNKNINIDLYSINYKEDDEIVPKYFIKLPYLTRSTESEYNTILHNKKLPFIQDILDSLYINSDADYLIFTNSDIGVQKNFYEEIYKIIISSGLNSFIIDRRDNIPKFIDNKRLSCDDLEYIYSCIGENHPGCDCFIMERDLIKKINLGNLFIGYPPWGYDLHNKLLNNSEKHYKYNNLYLTFHIGADKQWQNNNSELYLQNKKNSTYFQD